MTWAKDMLENMKQGTHQVPPIVRTLQLGLIDDWGDGWIRKTWHPKPELLQNDGTMFGGYIAALFDQAFAFAAMTVMEDDEACRTTSLNISFISLSRSEDILIEAKVVSRSRRLITVEATLSSNTGEIRSIATAQQMITKKTPPS